MNLNSLDNLFIIGFAAWRISSLFVSEVGPFMVFTKIREFFKIMHDESGLPIAWPSNSVLSCVWCLSVWFAFILYLLPIQISMIFGIAGVAAMLEAHNGKS